MNAKLGRAMLAFGLVVAIGGCAQVKQYAPTPVGAQYTLAGIPASLVHVRVTDLRASRADTAQLVQTIREQIQSALSTRAVAPTHGLYTLGVDIIEDRSYFTLGNWNAATKLRITLTDPHGRAVSTWSATGAAHRSNMFGYATARAVSQDAYNLAVANMMADLSSVELTGRQ